ncbi:hypothetical protein [Hirschia baltica]|uniref:Uncharacterized protein n=1 Tax=Hirschia baltica (strain ATCC 49814 / DSM 5838 / IFAM 1418) TaxID=582402 RepID=C6XMM1_HIRBI|nr:hypothetical protein [Hirschia baltica]ACT59935.1 hypothetical protein Hbal_2255 [Hirschia baltica ATCC 49814]
MKTIGNIFKAAFKGLLTLPFVLGIWALLSHYFPDIQSSALQLCDDAIQHILPLLGERQDYVSNSLLTPLTVFMIALTILSRFFLVDFFLGLLSGIGSLFKSKDDTRSAKDLMKAGEKEAKAREKQEQREAAIAAKEAEKQAKIDAKLAAEQAKIDEKAAAEQAKADAKAAAIAAKQQAAEEKEHAKAAKKNKKSKDNTSDAKETAPEDTDSLIAPAAIATSVAAAAIATATQSADADTSESSSDNGFVSEEELLADMPEAEAMTAETLETEANVTFADETPEAAEHETPLTVEPIAEKIALADTEIKLSDIEAALDDALDEIPDTAELDTPPVIEEANIAPEVITEEIAPSLDDEELVLPESPELDAAQIIEELPEMEELPATESVDDFESEAPIIEDLPDLEDPGLDDETPLAAEAVAEPVSPETPDLELDAPIVEDLDELEELTPPPEMEIDNIDDASSDLKPEALPELVEDVPESLDLSEGLSLDNLDDTPDLDALSELGDYPSDADLIKAPKTEEESLAEIEELAGMEEMPDITDLPDLPDTPEVEDMLADDLLEDLPDIDDLDPLKIN